MVVDLNEDLARQVGGEMGCAWCTALEDRLGAGAMWMSCW